MCKDRAISTHRQVILQETTASCLALLLGFAAAWIAIGSPARILNGWLMIDSDYPYSAAAFALFATDNWHWPLGANPHFGGVNIFFSDSAPWFALLAKLLTTLGLPAPSFHVLVLLNFLLYALFAHRLMSRLSADIATRWFGTLLLVFCLIMPVRTIGAQHIALSSCWVLLWAMAAVPMRDEEEISAFRRCESVPALAFATWSHAYLAAMSAAVILFCLLARRRLFAVPLVFALPLALLWAIGALQGVNTALPGAKLFGLDLLAPVQTYGWALLPEFYKPGALQQGDSFVFIGTGALAALIAALLLRFTRIRARPAEPLPLRLKVLAAAGLALFLFGMAFNLRIAGPVLLDLPIPALILPLYESFWAVGRFGAPLSFVLVVTGPLLIGRQRFATPVLAAAITVTAVALQIGDLVHAGRVAITDAQRQDVVEQRATVTRLLADTNWSGRVFRHVDAWEQLSPQRLLDYLLVEAGATEIRIAHAARPDPQALANRNGIADAGPGDLAIYPGTRPDLACTGRANYREFELCLR